jgi:hypothetical protein
MMLTIIAFMLFLTLSAYLPVGTAHASSSVQATSFVPATGPEFTFEGLSLTNTCNPNCPGLTPGVLKGWSEGDWVPYQLKIKDAAEPFSVVIELDYRITKSDKYAIDAFKSCFPSTIVQTTDHTVCSSGGVIGHVLVNTVDTDVSSSVSVVTGPSNDIIQFSVEVETGTTIIQWSNHLAVSGGDNLANLSSPDGLGLSSEPSSHANGASTWPGARIHEAVELPSGQRDVPINPNPRPGQGSSSISTTIYDTGFCDSTCAVNPPNTGGTSSFTAYAQDNFYDTATLTVLDDASANPTGTVTYSFYATADCTGSPTTSAGPVDGTFASPTVDFSAPTGPLEAGSYSFQASYSGDSNYQGSTSDCELLPVNAFTPVAPQVTKTATPSFTLTYGWTVEKLCSFDNVHFSSTCTEDTTSSSVKVYYRITVTHDAGTASDWQVTGDIYVNNPNLGSFAYDSVADKIVDSATHLITDTHATCPVGTGNDAAYQNTGTFDPSGGFIPAGDTVDFPYTCTYSAAPSFDGETNKATVSWSEQTISFTDNGVTHSASLASGSQPAFSTDWTWSTDVTPTVVNGCVQAVDSQQGTLGTVCVGDLNPTDFYYSKTFMLSTNACLSVTNTATIYGPDGTGAYTVDLGESSATVKVCPRVSGYLTMGFWQNKNGQSIIKGGASTSGVCNLATWLRQYAPFQDLSPTAKCAEVASYYIGVFNVANAGGSSMNAMLKAQMLATALDVYFSDPALGGNKINAPGPLGGVVIDLTHICKNIPTCTTYEGVSSAFNGQSSMTVNEMLAWAASQSNSGGSTWYGNVKATQGLAKDAFDAINNNVAFV